MFELPDADQIADLLAKLDDLKPSLTQAQVSLLEAMVKLAREVTDYSALPEDLAFGDEFAAAFTPHQAELVIAYASASISPHMVVRGVPLPGGTASPGMVVRNPGTGTVTPGTPSTPPVPPTHP
jgi:hypothetical protein